LTKALQRMLRRLNYQVISTNSAREAIQLFRANTPEFDLVITDFTMPEMNGLELASQIRAIRPDLPVLLASGFAPNLSAEKLRAAGVYELIEKPASQLILAEVVHRALSQKP
jgi:DNA-binding NtrC family response regulator